LLSAKPCPLPLTLTEVLAAARTDHPTLRVVRLRTRVDQASVDIARELPNPEARYERAKDTPRDSLGLTQLVDLPPKRSRRLGAARAAALTGRAEIAEVEADVAGEARRAFYALAAAQRHSSSRSALLDLARRARDAAAATRSAASRASSAVVKVPTMLVALPSIRTASYCSSSSSCDTRNSITVVGAPNHPGSAWVRRHILGAPLSTVALDMRRSDPDPLDLVERHLVLGAVVGLGLILVPKVAGSDPSASWRFRGSCSEVPTTLRVCVTCLGGLFPFVHAALFGARAPDFAHRGRLGGRSTQVA
jgi:hypothetical protein